MTEHTNDADEGLSMLQSPQKIRVSRGGDVHEATISWKFSDQAWVVAVTAGAFERVEAVANDAFEALCLVRAELEPHGWRLGVAGAQIDVWPSGMARDQGGGRVAYRVTPDHVGGIVEVFEPVDPVTVTTLAVQRAETERRLDSVQRGLRHR